MRKALALTAKILLSMLLAAAALISLSEVSPIYDFAGSRPFSGRDVFDPYAGVNPEYGWKRASFHTHTRVRGIFNECPEWPDVVYRDYLDYGYDILAFSNHNKLTDHPQDSSLTIRVYEHGLNFFKYHIHVYNPERVRLRDIILPVLPSQRQWIMDRLSGDADFTALNHPDRTNFTTARTMEKLSGYTLIEADSGRSTELRHWDEALSAGHYSFCYLNDDCHDSGDHTRIARRCTFLNSASESYPDIRDALLSGRLYSMRIPDFGNGDPEIKHRENGRLPRIESTGARGDTLFLSLSEPADSIKITGQGHRTLHLEKESAYTEYKLAADESYGRFTAYFRSGVVIYTNAFARYDASASATPSALNGHRVNIPLTILFNIAMFSLAGLFIFLIAGLFRKRD